MGTPQRLLANAVGSEYTKGAVQFQSHWETWAILVSVRAPSLSEYHSGVPEYIVRGKLRQTDIMMLTWI